MRRHLSCTSFRRMAILLAIFGVALLAVAATPAANQSARFRSRYLSPGELAISPDGRRLYVVCENSDELRVVDAHPAASSADSPSATCRGDLHSLADGKQIYVANSWTDTVSEIDAQRLQVVADFATGFEPIGVVADREARRSMSPTASATTFR